MILNVDNYGNWSQPVINALKSKNKLGFVDGTLTKPASTTADVHAWEKCGSMATAWLYNVIDKNLHGSTAYASTARVIWIDLEERYSQANCKCGKAMASILEQEKVHKFLMGPDHKKYNTVRSNILSQELLPNLNKVYAAIVREERQL